MTKQQAWIAFGFGALVLILLFFRPQSASSTIVQESNSMIPNNPLATFAPDFERSNSIMDFLGNIARPNFPMPGTPVLQFGDIDLGDTVLDASAPILDTGTGDKQCCRTTQIAQTVLMPSSPKLQAATLAKSSYGQITYVQPQTTSGSWVYSDARDIGHIGYKAMWSTG